VGLEGVRGKSVMEFASCYDQSASIVAASAFMTLTATFTILAAFAASRLIAMSGSVDRLQPAYIPRTRSADRKDA